MNAMVQSSNSSLASSQNQSNSNFNYNNDFNNNNNDTDVNNSNINSNNHGTNNNNNFESSILPMSQSVGNSAQAQPSNSPQSMSPNTQGKNDTFIYKIFLYWSYKEQELKFCNQIRFSLRSKISEWLT